MQANHLTHDRPLLIRVDDGQDRCGEVAHRQGQSDPKAHSQLQLLAQPPQHEARCASEAAVPQGPLHAAEVETHSGPSKAIGAAIQARQKHT